MDVISYINTYFRIFRYNNMIKYCYNFVNIIYKNTKLSMHSNFYYIYQY